MMLNSEAFKFSSNIVAMVTYYSFAMKQEAVFEGLGMLGNSQNLAHASEGVNFFV